MCMVSIINDYGHLRVQLQQWTHQTWSEYQEILRRLADLDRKLGEPNCETADKLEWQKSIEERLSKLEQQQSIEDSNG